MKIVFATENPGKLSEVRAFAKPYKIEIVSPSQAGLTVMEVEETGSDYKTNASLKVEAYLGQQKAKELTIVGDDTGIEIDALGKEPGVHTRRWLGYRMSDDEIIGYTFGRMYGIKDGNRTAKFTSTLAYSVNGSSIQFVTGELPGRIVTQPMLDAPAQEGLPYRKLFMVTGDREIPLWQFEQLPINERPLSHRESAFKNLFETLKLTEK